MLGVTTRSYVQQWDDLHLIECVLFLIWRRKGGLHQFEQLVAPGDYHRALVRLIHKRARTFWRGSHMRTVEAANLLVRMEEYSQNET